MNRTREEAIEELRQMVLVALGGHDAAVWLFGSCARGELQQHTDIDIAILPRDELPLGFFGELQADIEESTIPYDVDLVDMRYADRALSTRSVAKGRHGGSRKAPFGGTRGACDVGRGGRQAGAVADRARRRDPATDLYVRGGVEGVPAASGGARRHHRRFAERNAIRAARRLGWLSDEDARTALAIGNDRNLAVHMYRGEIGAAIEAHLAGHAALLRRWLDSLQQRVGDRE